MACNCKNCSCPDSCKCTGVGCKNDSCSCNCHNTHERKKHMLWGHLNDDTYSDMKGEQIMVMESFAKGLAKTVDKNMDKKQIAKESITIVLSGLLLAYPISIVVIYLCIDVIGMPSVFATSLNTFVLTVVAFIRVFFIRVYTEKQK